MSNQPPGRPWFRLGSISRPQSAPAPAPAPTVTPAPAPTTQPRPSIIARPAFRPVTPPAESTPPPPPPPAPAAPTPAVVSPLPPAPITEPSPAVTPAPPPQPPIVTVTAPPPPPQPQQPIEVRAPPPVIRIPSVPSSPNLRPSAPTASLPQISRTMRPTQPSPKKEFSPPELARGIPPPSSPARKDSSPKSASSSSSSSSSSSAKSSPEVKPAARFPTPKLKPAAVQPPPAAVPPPPVAVPPPPPLVLPPPQIRAGEIEPKIPPVTEQQKTVLVQRTFEKPKPAYEEPFKPTLSRNGKQDASRTVEGKEKQKSTPKKHTDSQDGSGMTIITIAGDNTGAVMDLVRSPKKHGFTGKPHFLFDKVRNVRDKMLSDGTESESSNSSINEGKSKSKKDMSLKLAKQSLPMNAYMNSNVQGINNSIVYNSSSSHHDPGVHLALTKKPADGGFAMKERKNVYHSD